MDIDAVVIRRRVLSHHDPLQELTELIIEMFRELNERISMTDENVTELRADYEQYKADVNAKIQALIDAANNTNGTVPADVQEAINALGAEIRSDDAALTGGTGVTPTDPQSPEQPSQTV